MSSNLQKDFQAAVDSVSKSSSSKRLSNKEMLHIYMLYTNKLWRAMRRYRRRGLFKLKSMQNGLPGMKSVVRVKMQRWQSISQS